MENIYASDSTELTEAPRWVTYSWMTNELRLSGEKLVIFSLLFERDSIDGRGPDEITGSYIVKCVNSCGLRSRTRGSNQEDRTLADVFQMIGNLAAEGLIDASLDERNLTTVYRCREDIVADAVEKARSEKIVEASDGQ